MTLSKSVAPPLAARSESWGPRGSTGISFAAALEFENVRCEIGGRQVLKGTSFKTSPGEILCLLGASGCGKSTILRATAGLQGISSGAIKINNKIMSDAQNAVRPEKRGTGLMFQDFALFPHMSILENVTYGLKTLGREEARNQAMQSLRRVGLADRWADYPSQLSGGQQQRLALARSVAPKPGLLLLDEPFSSLDARLRETVRAETLAVLRETRATCVIVTHDPEEAMLFGDKIALLEEGKITQIGSADEIYYAPKNINVARFFSPLSELLVTVSNGYAETPFGKMPIKDKADGAKLLIALRPVGSLNLVKQGGIAGRIVNKHAALGIDLVEIAIGGLDQPLQAKWPATDNLHVGQDVNIAINFNHVLVFDAD